MATETKDYLERIGDQVESIVEKQRVDGEQLKQLQRQLDGVDLKLASRLTEFSEPQSLTDRLRNDDQITHLVKHRSGSARIHFDDKEMRQLLGYKTTITSGTVGTATTGVLQIDRIPGITPEARQQLKIRDLLASNPTTMQVVDFVKVLTPMTIASPVPEASLKPENQLNFASVSEKVRLIATWIPATRQILDDFTELGSFLGSTMPYYVNLAEELQLLYGDGTGENLHGLVPQAAPFNPALLVGTSNSIDVVGRAIEQITGAKELDPSFVVLHPNNWWNMRLLKDSFGRYILGDPQTNVRPSLFGLDVVYTTSMSYNTFLVGSGSPIASEIRDRMDMQVEISTEHQDYFVRNMVAIRAEKRLCLVVKRPGSYVTGSFAGVSPA